MRATLLALLAAVGTPVGVLAAQGVTGRPGPRIVLPRDHEVVLARSAAPPSVHAGARVWVFADGRYVVVDSGTTGVECYGLRCVCSVATNPRHRTWSMRPGCVRFPA